MARYAIWNKKDIIFTPIGEALTPEKWIERYPIAGFDSITVVCAAGEINGAFFGTLGSMMQMAEAQGCDFSTCTTDEERLAAIEAFEDEKNAEALNYISTEERTAVALESIASGQTAESTAVMNALLTGEEE